MKTWQEYTMTVLGLLCLGLSVATVITAASNQQMQDQLQRRQVQINNSVIGPRGRQISTSLLRDMGSVGMKNDKMKELLERHGMTLQKPEAAAAAGETSTSEGAVNE